MCLSASLRLVEVSEVRQLLVEGLPAEELPGGDDEGDEDRERQQSLPRALRGAGAGRVVVRRSVLV